MSGTQKKTTALAELVDDLTFGTPSDGQVLTFSSGTNKVVFATPSPGASPAGSDGQLQATDGAGGLKAVVGSSSDGSGNVGLGGTLKVGTGANAPMFQQQSDLGSTPRLGLVAANFSSWAILTARGLHDPTSDLVWQAGGNPFFGCINLAGSAYQGVGVSNTRLYNGTTLCGVLSGTSAANVTLDSDGSGGAASVIVTTAANNHVTLGTSTPVNNDYYMVVSCVGGVGQIYAVRQGVGAVPIAIDSGGAGVTFGGAITVGDTLHVTASGNPFRLTANGGANAIHMDGTGGGNGWISTSGSRIVLSPGASIEGLSVDSSGNVVAASTLKPGTIDTSTVPGTVAGQICYSSALNKTCEWDGADWQPLR